MMNPRRREATRARSRRFPTRSSSARPRCARRPRSSTGSPLPSRGGGGASPRPERARRGLFGTESNLARQLQKFFELQKKGARRVNDCGDWMRARASDQ
eukprot:29720-Pelagococcus_subviridis.AAC.4